MWGRALVCLSVLPWPLASAAPWVEEEGRFYTRVSIASERVEGVDAWRRDAFAEYGFAQHWTLSAKLEAVSYDQAAYYNGDGWRATIRRKVYDRDGFVASIEVGALEGAAIGGRNGCETIGSEVRAGVGWSGVLQETLSFAFAELAQRDHENCQRRRYELGFGQALFENIWLINQVWIEDGSGGVNSNKVQSELLWRLGSIDLSIGLRNEIGGEFVEDSIFLAAAKRF